MSKPARSEHLSVIASARWLAVRLLAFVLLLGSASSAMAASANCSSYPLDPTGMFHLINGADPTLTSMPSSIGLDANCYIENFQQSAKWPLGLTSTINYQNTNPASLAVFTNVYYNGNMACSNTNTKLWFVNSSFAGNNQCQSIMIPVEAIGKSSPAPSATIGVPFTYTMTIPVMYSAGTYTTQPSTNTLAKATLYDDLTATGASMTYVSNTAYLVNGATRTPIGPLALGASSATLLALGTQYFGVPLPLPSDSTKHIVFSCDNNPLYLCGITAGTQVEIQMTVVLDNVPANTAPTSFTNTASWWFGRVIDGVAYDPLPGQGGVAQPMTIAEPNLTLQKTSTYTNVNVGMAVPFTLNVQNTGGSDAWNATITDNIPPGMCAYNPAPTVTAQMVASDGTPLPGALVAGTDYTVSFSGAGPCTLTVNMLSAAAKIGPTQRLLIKYQTYLDPSTPAGLTFTNVAGATLWYSAPSTDGGRRQYNRTLGTAAQATQALDFQDAWTLTSTTQGYFFLKSVGDLSTGATLATAAYPGDRLRYTLQIQNFTFPVLNNITVNDDLDAAFVPGTLALASVTPPLPAGATLTVSPTGGANGTGSVMITGLNLASNTQYQVQFDVTLASALTNGTTVRNQGSLTGTDTQTPPVTWSGVSDDPNIGGPALLGTTGDITPITINAPGALGIVNTQATATIGQQFTYRITVSAPPGVPLYDVHILDDLGASAANLSFVSATVVSGGTWNVTNTGTATNLVLQDTNTGIDIPAGGQAVIDVTVALQNTSTNKQGLTFTNTASYTYDKINGDTTTQGTTGLVTSGNMTVVEPVLSIAKAVSYASPTQPITTPAAVGNMLQYTITVTNNGTSTAYATDVLDALPSNLAFVTGSATATITVGGVTSGVTGFIPAPTTLANGMLAWGAQNGDSSLNIPVNGTLVLSFQASVLSANGAPITNTAYADWTSLSGGAAGERTGAGCPFTTAPNTYCTIPATATVTSLDPTALAKAVTSDSWTTAPAPATLRVGDTVVYTVTATLREGTTQNVVLTDTLPANMAFDSIVSIDGVTAAPYTPPTSGAGSNFSYTLSSYPAAGQTGTVTWNFGNISNAIDNIASNNGLVIQYRARVVNTLPVTPLSPTLSNNAVLNYAINGVAATPKSAYAQINVWQPLLSVSKTAAPAAGGTVVTPGELVTYTVNITNTGSAPAYNPVLQDILPVGMRNATPTTVSVNGTALNNVTPTYSSATGVATWNFTSATADQYTIPPGGTLTLVYQAQVDSTVGAGMILSNQAAVQHYYSLDSADPNAAYRKDYGATVATKFQLTTASPTALAKQAMLASAAIGQPFTYQITIPATRQPTDPALYDVRVLDNISLPTTGVTLNYLGSSAQLKSGAKTWATLTNSGSATNLILQDTTAGGLDIPAGDQLIVTVTLVLANDIINNTDKKTFTNTANYTYDSINNDVTTQANGGPGASGAITIAAPNLITQKSGPATMLNSAPGTFTLDVQNNGGATAWNPVVADILPSGTTGGMCASAPTGITAQVFADSTGTTPVSAALVNGTDFTVSFAPAPSCTLTINFLTPAAAVPPTDHLIIKYNASLDPGTGNGIPLTNIAGATQWLSANPSVPGAAGNVHTFSNTLTSGAPGVGAFTTTSAAPILTFTKTVFDVTTGQSGANARPGDTLKYTLTIQNVSQVAATNFSLTDDLDALNTSSPMFVPGTLTLVTVPAGANTSLTLPSGGSKGTGIVNISGLNVGVQGSATATAVVEFTARLVPAINNGTVVLNQAKISGSSLASQLSDDPSVGGTTDPTRTLIASAPAWRVQKTVQDITSGTSVVTAGDVLRYTITVKDIGTENATGVTLTDAIPNFTAYVAGSTRLNGTAVADPAAGVSALQNGMLITTPGSTAPGAMTADATATTTNVATVTFDVKVNASVINGTIVSNQGFVNGSGAASGPFPVAPSDDPATTALNDPTRVVVGNVPLLNATKTVTLVVDNNGNGAIDPGDVVRYTITVNNYSGTPATGVKLIDATPVNTAYMPNTVTLNGAGVGQPDGGVSPLIAGIGLNSPGAAAGTIAGGGQAVVTFNVQVNAGVAGGTVINNQGNVTSAQLPTLQTDADGDASNGYQPTTFVVGSAQQLSIAKQVSVVGGGSALPGSQLEYLIQVTNTGTVAATNVVITDDLSQAPLASQVSYVAGSATLNGLPAGVTLAGSIITGDYAATYGTLAPGATAQLRFRVLIAAGLTMGTTVTNTGQVAWNAVPTLTAPASVSVAVGGVPGSATLSGHVWYDANFNKVADPTELNLAGWSVQVMRNNVQLGSVTTDANGLYTVTGLAPTTSTADQYTLLFLAPGANATTAKLGRADSAYTNGLQEISGISAPSGGNLQNLNLPINPNGVVYNSILRTPVAGATVTMTPAGSSVPLPSTCFDDAAQQGQVTLSSGYYKFDLNFSDPSCPPGGNYVIQVTPPSSAYMPGESLLIPPLSDGKTKAFSVPTCPGSAVDAIPATTSYCESQPSEFAPGPGVAANAANYYLNLTLDNTLIPGHSQIFDNHIPLDPRLDSAVTITKTAAVQNVTKGQMIPYTITVSNSYATTLTSMAVVDTFPAGFKYVAGSGRLDGQPVEPVSTGTQLTWNNLQLSTNTKRVIQLMLIVGSGVTEGNYVNRAQVFNTITNGAGSPVATATVRVIPDPTLDCSDVIGKVFDDANLNGYQDEGEKGLPGVRVVSARGLIATTDQFGLFHLTCAVVPDPDRGSNFILKVDDRSLPSGYRLTTENPLVERATRGKMLKFNFGAAIHKVLRLDMADGVFEPGTTEMRVQWKPRIGLLMSELKKAPSVLRLSYLADVEDESLVKARVESVKREIADDWKKEKGNYDLTIETEVFWRTGAPPEKSDSSDR